MTKYFFLFILLFPIGLIAQNPSIYFDEDLTLQKADCQFEESLYSASQRSYKAVTSHCKQQDQQCAESLIAMAELGQARCQLKLGLIEGPDQLQSAVEEHFPNSYSYDATLDLADYYFNNRNFNDALTYYTLLEERIDNEDQKETIYFKLGYTHFIKKSFNTAGKYFSMPMHKKNPYYTKKTYYSGMVSYFLGDYENALAVFKQVENQKEYKSHIPYYICQIYFAQEKYDELIKYGNKILKKGSSNKKEEINLLLGQSYFIQENYKKALPHLEQYEQSVGKLSEDEFYQLGYTQYKLYHYDDAIENLIELSVLDNEMGELANYYLADSYLQVGDKISARTAFKQVSEYESNPLMQEEALYNYAKLSAEQGFEREAIHNLLRFSDHHEYSRESQSILSHLFLQTSDYNNAIKTIEGLPQRTDEMKNTLVHLYYQRALQLYNDGKLDQANEKFAIVSNSKVNNNYAQQSMYYQGLITHRNNDITNSISLTNKFIENGSSNLPDETNLAMGNYLQANNYLKNKNYQSAFQHFDKTIQLASSFDNPEIGNRIINESIIRAADCSFQIEDRNQAAKFYQKSIDLNDQNYVYANYQLAMIRGLEAKPYDKIVLLEKITKSDKEDNLKDDALMQLGDTYMSLQQFNEAFGAYKSIIQKHKKSVYVNQAFLKLGLIAYNQGDIQDALIYYKAMFDNNPNPVEIQQGLVSIREIYVEDLGQAEEYVLFAEEVAGHKISDFAKDSLNYSIAYNQYKNGKYKVAVEKFDKYIKKFNEGFFKLPAHYFRAESNTLMKVYSDAVTDYKKVIAAGQGEYYKNSISKAAIISYNHDKNYSEALKYYKLMGEESDESASTYEANLGALRSAYRIDRSEDIKLYATKVIQDPTVIEKDKITAFFYAGKAYYKEGQHDQAIPSLNQVVRLSSNEQAAESKYMLAEIFFKKEMYEKAKTQCLDISDNTANYPYWVAKSLILLADVLVETNDFFNAKAALEAVIEHYKDDKEILAAATEKLEEVKSKESKKSRLKKKGKDDELEME